MIRGGYATSIGRPPEVIDPGLCTKLIEVGTHGGLLVAGRCPLRPPRRRGIIGARRDEQRNNAPWLCRSRPSPVPASGKMTLRRAGRMHHLGVGAAHARKRVLAFADDHQITVADLRTGEVLSVHLIEPNKTYWRNQNREPGRWPSSSN